MVASEGAGIAVIMISGFGGLAFAFFQMWLVSLVSIDGDVPSMERGLIRDESKTNSENTKSADENEKSAESNVMEEMRSIYNLIKEGAKAFLLAEYTLCAVFIVVFGGIVFVLTSYRNKKSDAKDTWDFKFGALTAMSFVIGSVTSIIAGYIGMMVAVYSNARTTRSAMQKGEAGWINSFNTAFRAGGVMGFSLCGLAVLVLYVTIRICREAYGDVSKHEGSDDRMRAYKDLFECVAGFGLGGSSIAMFGRVGGGIYTKAADVGADLAGKVVIGLPEDDPRNPAVIADNVGDNVGDVAGMGSDLFGSFGEATCAALVIASQSQKLTDEGFSAVLFPLYISAAGIVVCFFTSFFATNIMPVRKGADVETVLKTQLGVSTLLMTAAMYPVCLVFLPSEADFEGLDVAGEMTSSLRSKAFLCTCMGLWGGCLIGFLTEYFTSHSYTPVREVAESTETGAATNIIYGLALGYKSAVLPATIISVIVFVSFKYLGMFGISLAALGMLSTLATCLSIDVFGPVCDNAGGIAEMAGCHEDVRKKTDTLDAAGNTTAAIGKGFAIGSAALVSLALFGAFTTKCKWGDGESLEKYGVNILRPITFAFLIMGAMLPYWFTAMTMKSVGHAAKEMVNEVKNQFHNNKDLLRKGSGAKPDYAKCIAISTQASLKEMVAPGLLVMLSPIFTGIFFGVEAVAGLLAGSLVSSVQMAISQSNTGGAWDNAKKYIEAGHLELTRDGEKVTVKKGDEEHKAAVCGDTVGDPLKDTSGPALNIVMKLMAIISLVFSGFFLSINDGRGVFKIESWASTFIEHNHQ